MWASKQYPVVPKYVNLLRGSKAHRRFNEDNVQTKTLLQALCEDKVNEMAINLGTLKY